MNEEHRIEIEEVEGVAPPPKARVSDAPVPDAAATFARKRDYLEGFLSQKPAEPEGGSQGADLYEDLYVTITDIIREGVDQGVFATALDPRALAETAVALTDGLGERVLANDPHLGLEQARGTIATMVGVLVGHDGPLP